MPPHVISDTYEWIRGSLCPYLLPSETTAKETVFEILAGEEEPV